MRLLLRRNYWFTFVGTITVLWITGTILKSDAVIEYLSEFQSGKKMHRQRNTVNDKITNKMIAHNTFADRAKEVHLNQSKHQSPMILDSLRSARRQTLLDVCKGNEFNQRYRGTRSDREIKDHFVLDREHQFLYCAMEKVGSTFWRRLWQIIVRLSHFKSPYEIPPGGALGGGQETMKNLAFDEIHTILSTYRSFVLVRHPYYRLFPGYVDKIFSPNPAFWKGLSIHIASIARGQTNQSCVSDISFREFVKYFIHSETTNSHRDGHFVPMHDHCRPCQILYDVIGKMETFVDDTLFMVKALELHDLYSILNKEMRNSSLSDTLRDQTEILFRYRKAICVSFYDAQRRVWTQLQIRGVISKYSTFPFTKEQAERMTQEIFIYTLEKAVGDANTPGKSKLYREEAFVEAFRSIPKDDLSKLFEILRPDCDIFGYDCSLESLYNKFDKYQSEELFFDQQTL